jgi:hypothetical protein
MRAVGCASCIAAVIIALAACPADALDVRVAWQPVQGVAGYRLYMRPAGQPYGLGTDVGLLPADVDGIIRYVVANVPLGTTYFVVTAYDAAGAESAFSNELALAVSASPTATSGAAPPSPAPSTVWTPTSVPATATRTATAVFTATRTSTAVSTATRTATTVFTGTPATTAVFTATRTATPANTATRTPTLAFTATHTPAPTSPASTSATPTGTAIAGSGITVSGSVRYYANDGPVPGTTMTMRSTLGTMTATTDEHGDFRFDGVGLGTWQLFAEKDGDLQRGISSYDAAFVLQTVSGLRALTAVERLACDVTGNGALSALDATRILQYAVGQLARLPVASRCGSDWVFVPEPPMLAGTRAVDAEITSSSCQPASIMFEPLRGSMSEQNFVAAVFGDCTGNWSDGAAVGALRQIAPPARARLGAARRRPGERWLVPLHVEGRDTLDAFEARLGYDPGAARLKAVERAGESTDSMLDYRADTSGEITIALAGTAPLALGKRPLVVLVFSATDEPAVWLNGAVVDNAPARIEEPSS